MAREDDIKSFENIIFTEVAEKSEKPKKASIKKPTAVPMVEEPDAPDPTHSRPTPQPEHVSDYFLNIGFVNYGGQYTLVDRQIYPFGNMGAGTRRKDIVFQRWCLRVHADHAREAGKLVLDTQNIPRAQGWAELHPSSYIAELRPDSVAGFFGMRSEEKGGINLVPATHLHNAMRFHSFNALDNSGDSHWLWPSFFFQVDKPRPGAVEMFNVESLEWEWVIELDMAKPVVMGCRPDMSDQALLEMLNKVRWYLADVWQLMDEMRIGMRNIWHKDSMWVNGPAPDNVQWETRRIKTELLPSTLLEKNLKIQGWAFPTPNIPATIRAYEAKVLNAHAVRQIGTMS